MVIVGLIDSNQYAKKWRCEAEISEEFHRCKMHSRLDNYSPHFAWYGENTRIYEPRTFVCDIPPITSSPKKLDYRA